MCRFPVRPRGTIGASRLFDAGGYFDRIVWPRTVSQPRASESLRLPISPHGIPSGDFAEAFYRFNRDSEKASATRAAKHMQPPSATSQKHEGVRGEASIFASPRRLSAAFDARKRLPVQVELQPQRLRGTATHARGETAHPSARQIPVYRTHTVME